METASSKTLALQFAPDPSPAISSKRLCNLRATPGHQKNNDLRVEIEWSGG